MHRLKLVVLGTGVLFATPALAEDPAAPTEEVPADPTTGGAGSGMEAAVEGGGAAGATGASAWTTAAIDRPYVRGKGQFAAYGGLFLARVTFPAVPPLIPNSTTVTSEGLQVGGSYGITDQIGAGLQYAFALNEFEAKGPLTVFGNYQITHGLKMSVAANADFELDLCGSTDMNGDCVSAKTIHAGLGARYNIAPTMAVYTGTPFGPGPFGQHLSISLESDGPIDFSVPVGFGFQAMPQLLAFAQTNLATIHFNPPPMGDSVSFIFDAFIPLTIGGLYSVNKDIDVGATIEFLDLKNAGDALGIGVFARYYGGT